MQTETSFRDERDAMAQESAFRARILGVGLLRQGTRHGPLHVDGISGFPAAEAAERVQRGSA